MSFLTPSYLILAGLALPIIVLYMLRLRRREVQISSVMLWQRLMQDREANAPWQRLRRNLLLLLQLLILAALVIALARPFFPVPSVASGSVALLIDTSASMNATDMPGGSTRLDAALSRARDLVGELSPDEVMTVIAVASNPVVLSPPTADKTVLRDSLARVEATDTAADWEAALTLAGASIAGRAEAAIVIISDGGLPDDLPALPAEIRYVSVGRESSNLAVSALAVRPLDGYPQLFARITNYGEQDAAAILSLSVDGDLVTAERLAVAAGDTTSLTIDDLPGSSRLIRAELSPPVEEAAPDYLHTDDVAYAVYTPPAGGEVLLLTESNLFLSQLLSAFSEIAVTNVPPGDLPEENYDLVIFDGYVPETLPQTDLLIINPQRSTDLFTVGDTFTDTRFLRQVDDPLLAFVEFRNIAILEARQVQVGGWARVMAEAEGGPLLLAGTEGSRQVAILTFDLHNSDLPLQIAFPILMANLLEWYAPARPFQAAERLQPGDPVIIRPQVSTTGYRVTLPDGTRESYSATADALTFTRTIQPGFYTVELLAGGQTTTRGSFAVNLFSPFESDIAPRGSVLIGQLEIGDVAPEDEYGQRELWPWLALLALVILVLEWWVYHRGSTITHRERAAREAAPKRRLLYFGRRR